MANSNRVFVSPGVYTSEKDLTFVAQSVGVTTLGIVGETLQGPAFEPILISNFDQFRTYFGNTSPIKDGNGNPKYELPYVAKSYLQESNQLFVTRVLGLTGYKPNETLGIKTLGGVSLTNGNNVLYVTFDNMDPLNVSASGFYSELSTKPSIDGTSITDYVATNFSGLTSANNGLWFVIGYVPDIAIAGLSNTEVASPSTGKVNADNNNGKEWYNTFFHKSGVTDSTIDYVYSYLFVYNSGTSVFDIIRFEFTAELNSTYADVVVAALRPRGHYSGHTLIYEFTSPADFAIWSDNFVDSNPFADFYIGISGRTDGLKTFTCSMDSSSSKYITKVLGSNVYDKSYNDYPIYVHEVYPNLLANLYEQGLVRGLSYDYVEQAEGTNFLREWDTAMSPMVVSEVRGNKVHDLFQVVTISDGDASNYNVKITIQNVNLDKLEFDILVRDFNDTDENQAVIEKFSRCSMDPSVPGYVARKIGTSDGQYALVSKYIMLNMSDNAPIDAVPAGFKGFVNNSNLGGSVLGQTIYKTNYFDAGEVMYYESDGTPVLSNGDRVRKVSLGLSSQNGFQYDNDVLKFKGNAAGGQTHGFHLSVNAASITGTTYDCTSYDLEGQTGGDSNKLTNINYRKFTFATGGGFDGWDIYRDVRTNDDRYIFGKSYYVADQSANGVFSSTVGNSDYYAYLNGIQTFANPEAVDINVFATPGINFYDHNSLTTYAIDMVENDRADSIYIVAAPNVSTAQEIVDDLDTVAIDSNYSATYWPWIQVLDTDNSTQLYIPPTGEVCRNIALTDNVSYPWFATAGYSRGLVNSVKALKKLTLDERDNLYTNRINPIATFSDTGTIIWGNKTLQVKESALDRINVRRLLLRARKLISAVAVRLLFEQNDDQVRQEFLRLVNPIMESIKKERGLYDFRVTVSNDPEDLDANTLRGNIYVKPTRSLEFIDLEFIITPTGASFENI